MFKSTESGYGRIAVFLHWVSALLILGMLPLGFLMQDANEAFRLRLYQLHGALGFLILLLTLARLSWKLFDPRPAPPKGLTGLHLRGMEGIHILLYLALLGLTFSGIALVVQSGLLDVLRGASAGSIPRLDDFRALAAHKALARVFLGLFMAHVGGVLLHQVRHGEALARMGLGRSTAVEASESSGS